MSVINLDLKLYKYKKKSISVDLGFVEGSLWHSSPTRCLAREAGGRSCRKKLSGEAVDAKSNKITKWTAPPQARRSG